MPKKSLKFKKISNLDNLTILVKFCFIVTFTNLYYFKDFLI
jgi:hypothetical protein